MEFPFYSLKTISIEYTVLLKLLHPIKKFDTMGKDRLDLLPEISNTKSVAEVTLNNRLIFVPNKMTGRPSTFYAITTVNDQSICNLSEYILCFSSPVF